MWYLHLEKTINGTAVWCYLVFATEAEALAGAPDGFTVLGITQSNQKP